MSEIEHFGPVCLSPNHTVFLKIVTILLFSPKAPREGDRKENQGMNVADTIKKFGLEQAFDYLYRDPERNLLKIMDWADRFDNGDFAVQRKVIRQAIEDPSHPYHQYILHIVQDVDPEVMKTVAVNLFINASMIGWHKQEVCRAQYQCNIPWAILLDPTSACNLHCTGCWAAEYGNRLNLTFDEIDRIIRQGKELGVYMYIYTGGEPLVRKDDLIRLCEKHSDCVFLCFTNGTLIDESFADEMLPSPWQREAVYRRIRRLRAEKPLFAMDFQNDAEYMGGCIAGGKRYLHINANGDVDPCVFVHYSNANIRSCTLLEALQSPIFMAYYHNMPFNENMLQPCPMLENPERLRKMVLDSEAHSTDPQSPESADHLCGKCDAYARHWAPEAQRLWAERKQELGL